jgi:hypothetical protein
MKAGAMKAGAMKAGAMKAGAMKAGAMKAGAVNAGPVKAGAVNAGPVTAGAVTAGAVSRRRVVRLLAVAVLVGVTSLGVPQGQALATSPSAVSVTKTVSRMYLHDGAWTTVAKNTVHLTVSQTHNLRSLQFVHVSWSGAIPTGGLVADQNSDLAQNEEHSMVLLECRGVDSTRVPVGQRISPETCWTQYGDERFTYSGGDAFPAWRSDAFAPQSERAAFVDAPPVAKQPPACTLDLLGTVSQRWVPFIGANGTTYPGGIFGCAGQAPEAVPANASSLALPSNETFGVTDRHGIGSADFNIFTAEDHASLGCSQTVPCSLVAIPIEGISCDSSGSLAAPQDRPGPDDLPGAVANCETNGALAPGSILPPQISGTAAVDGSLWWSASNWRNRISVPLTFAVPDNVCSLHNASAPVEVYGSELMIQAGLQWAPHFCLDASLFNFDHVQTPEPLARSLVNSGAVEAAFTSEPPDSPYQRPVVNAPVAVTGFGIAFTIDDANGNPISHLRLDARLLAKLLTESYPDQPFIRDYYPALQNNPVNITADPEFQALNPGIPNRYADGAATLQLLNTQSDVIEALTSYINADPDARAFLNGKPDPWGMVVNPNYKGFALPTNSWPLLDTFEPKQMYTIDRIACLAQDPVPYLPLVAAPTARLFSIAQDIQFALSQSQVVCSRPDPTSLDGAKMVAAGRQAAGAHFLLGVVSLGDAARGGLQLAGLETQKSPTAADKFSDAAGRTFVEPSLASMKAATALLRPDAKTGTWPVPYARMRGSAEGAAAYPGTLVVYAAVPTSGLPHGDAKDYAELLRFAAGPGQVPGENPGQLPNGYLPLTAGNGLGQLADYTVRAAAAVSAQHGAKPSLVASPTAPSGPSSSPSSPAIPPAGGATGGTGVPGGSTGALAGGGAKTSSGTHARSAPKDSSSVPGHTTGFAARTTGLTTGVGGLAVPLLLLLGLGSGAALGAVRLLGRGQRA